MELHLFRHGQTDWNEERRVQGQSDSQLTELGITQARNLGERIRHLDFDRVFCSSSLRTRQTAEHAFADSAPVIEYRDALREIQLGPWEGHLYDEVEAREPESFNHFWHEPHLFDVAGAETFFQAQQRAMEELDRIAKAHAQQRIAVVSHGALIKSILCHVEDKHVSKLWEPPNMHNCSHSIVRFLENGDRIIVQYADQP